MSPLRRRRLRRAGAAALVVLPAVLVVLALQVSARATHEVVTLTGTVDADHFLVGIKPDDSGMLYLCAEVCFDRARSEVGTIVVEGYDGDDVLTVHHGHGFATNSDGDLAISFDAGPGSDQTTLCTVGPEVPNEFVDTDCLNEAVTTVHPGASADEVVVTQKSAESTDRVTITSNDVGAVIDETPGQSTVHGTADDDSLTIRQAGSGTGEVVGAGQGPYRFLDKAGLTVDTGTGADDVLLERAAGLSGGENCAPAGAVASRLCIRADTADDDMLRLMGQAAEAEQMLLTARRAGASSLGGAAAVTGGLHLAGIDDIALGMQNNDDAFTLTTSGAADEVRAVTTDTGVTLAGRLATDGTAYSLPRIEVTGDGTAPLEVAWNGAEGDDRIELVGSEVDERVVLGPTDLDDTNKVPDTECVSAGTTCLISGSAAGERRLTLAGVERHLLRPGPGDDNLLAAGATVGTTMWRGSDGSDRAVVRGTGDDLRVDLDARSISQDGWGAVTATATESFGVDAAGASVTTATTAGADSVSVQPTEPDAATVQSAGAAPRLELTGVDGVHALDAGGGDDTVTVHGTTGADRFAVGRGTALSVQVADLLPVRVHATESAVLAAGDGDDRVDVTGDGGPATLQVAGGPDAGADQLTFAEARHDATVSVDDEQGTGQLAAGTGPPVGFRGVERVDVEGDTAGTLTVQGSDAPDTVTQLNNTVSVGRTTDVEFSRFPRLELAAGAADDSLWLTPVTTSGVDTVSVRGGGEADTVTVRGTLLSERITYRPSARHAATVQLPGAPLVSTDAVEDTRVDGGTAPPSGDTLVVETPRHDGTLRVEPGSTFDSGTVAFLDVTGSSNTAAPLQFGGLGRGELRFAAGDGGPADRVLLDGRVDDDVIGVSTRSEGGRDVAVATVSRQLPVAVPGAQILVLDGRQGADAFRMRTDHPVSGDGAPAIEVHGGGPDSGDRLDLTAGTGALLADLDGSTVGQAGHAAIQHSGVEHIALAANGNDLDVVGGDGPDSVTTEPTGPAAVTVTASGTPRLAGSGLATFTVATGAGADTVGVTLRSTADSAGVVRGETTRVASEGLQTVLLAPAVEALQVDAGDGADEVVVTGAGGPASLTVDGGAPVGIGDILRLVAPDTTVSYDPEPDSGRLDSPGGALTFSTMETVDVIGDGSGTLSVNATDGGESVTIGESNDPRIGVDDGAAVTYAGYPDVVLNARAGNDDVTVGYTALGDITRLHVRGGPGGGDSVSIADTTGATREFTVRPTTPTSGTVTATGQRTALLVETTETATIDGRGGDDSVRVVSPSGFQQARSVPGGTADSGLVRIGSLLPTTYRRIGAGRLVLSDAHGDRVDSVTVVGTAGSDRLTVAGGNGEVALAGAVPVVPESAAALHIEGGDGDDAVTASGPLPFATTSVHGGAPDLGDSLTLQGPSGPVEADLGRTRVTGYGGVVTFPGVVDLHTDVGGQTLRQVGTARDDAVCYDPMAPRDGRLYIVGAPGGGTASSICMPDQRGLNVLHTFVDVAELVVDPAAGKDEVIVNGTTSRDLLTVHAQAPLTEVTVHPEPELGSSFRLPVHVTVDSTESVVVAADNGSDSVDVSAYDSAAPLITVHGEGPATRHLGDDLVLRDATGAAHLHDTGSQTKGSGTVTAEYRKGSAAVIRVDYVDMEDVMLIRDPKAGD
ncbi:MAG TPA: hypothetical protein VHG70_14490 [Nocardioidaceae bacterium]|nr:hypothetical protein [Nocardioidaceae bacterium]